MHLVICSVNMLKLNTGGRRPENRLRKHFYGYLIFLQDEYVVAVKI